MSGTHSASPTHEIIMKLSLLSDPNPDDVLVIRKQVSQQYKLVHMPSNAEILKSYFQLIKNNTIIRNKKVESLLRKRAVRSQSGIVPVQVLTKPFWCPGECIFCPNDATMPKSYINTEPGAQRALLNNFDPYKQVFNRLLSLTLTGHETDKIEMIVLGGTRDVYPKEYKTWFIKWLYDACNVFEEFFDKYISGEIALESTKSIDLETLPFDFPSSIHESITINETATCRVIWLTIETRPEYVTDENCQYRRHLGVTRIEMGIQNMFDDVLVANKRGHTIEQCKNAMHKLRQYGFKISVHLMPWLYTSTIEQDIETFQIAFTDHAFCPDELKFYPTAVIPNTPLFDLYAKGKYTPLSLEENKHIIKTILTKHIPPYTRIKRLIRDIPAEETVWSNYVTNLRQLVENELQDELRKYDLKRKVQHYKKLYPHLTEIEDENDLLNKMMAIVSLAKNTDKSLTTHTILDETVQTFLPKGTLLNHSDYRAFICLDTRSREIRNNLKSNEIFPIVRSYLTTNGVQLFISFEDELGYLYGFARLQLGTADTEPEFEGVWTWVALIRELHVYWQLTKISYKENWRTQHKWLWGQLMELAERIAQYCSYSKISVISWVGVRKYYERLGYVLEGTYMVKNLSN